MSLLGDALQPHFLHNINSVEGRSVGMPLNDLIGKQGKIGFLLDFDNADEVIRFDFQDHDPVLKSFVNDCSRFAASSFQSIAFAYDEADDGERLSWALIKAYYAAFYAGHSIIRAFGHSCTFLDRNHTNRIVSLAQAQNKVHTFKISSTVYHCSIGVGQSAIFEARKLRQGSGGAHEAFWHVFAVILKELSEKTLLGSLSVIEAQSAFSKLDAIRQSLTSRGSPFHSWLSIVRNDVQYRHGHGVWMPCGVRKQDRETIKRILGQWINDPMDINVGTYPSSDLKDFASSCVSVVSLCRMLLERIASRAPIRSKSFARLGALALLPKKGRSQLGEKAGA